MKKKNIIALRAFHKDGTSSLYGDQDFYVGDIESDLVASLLATHEAKDYLEKGYVEKVNLCYVDAEWNFEVKEEKVLSEYELPLDTIEEVLARPMPEILPTGEKLQVLPDTCHNLKLYNKIEELRKNGKCIDYTKQNEDLEWDNNPWWYLHGALEDKVHYDKAVVLNATAVGDTRETVRWLEIREGRCIWYKDIPHRQMHINGIRRCNVIGVYSDCLGFFWTNEERSIPYDKGSFDMWKQQGLIVQKNDKWAVLDAYHKFLMRHETL